MNNIDNILEELEASVNQIGAMGFTRAILLIRAIRHEHARAESFKSELERLDPIVCPDDQEIIRQIIEMPDCAAILRGSP